ncbi:YidC/Oxa1 family membrane protein insertase [Herbiconiux daphne]|uniref:Membrane protein insertase YidC n=1 Tax=Herbiconiux daphne TaxID=2970914 RepID=A0ABT2H888_9MICO|nr:YidC/Oxa1 family membrane protein insertase [Herbiconiux daphne]MCS5736180.1 YidC/Oxa1 family membrane protein insertase [Herbiconiux daphne]
MNIYAFGPIAAALDGAYAVIQALSAALAALAGANAAAVAIVLVTVLVRTALIPVGLSQARAQRMRRRLAPRIAELRRRHGKNPERLQRETMALYAEENASPLAGCLPLLIQAPVLSLIYGLFILPTINDHPNALLSQTLVGAPLGTGFVAAIGSGSDPQGVVVSAVILALIAGISLVSRWRGLRWSAADAAGGSGGSGGGRGGQGSASASVSASAGTSGALAALAPGGSAARLLSWLPLVTVVVAAFVPLAASLYLLVTTAWTVTEREILRRTVV